MFSSSPDDVYVLIPSLTEKKRDFVHVTKIKDLRWGDWSGFCPVLSQESLKMENLPFLTMVQGRCGDRGMVRGIWWEDPKLLLLSLKI